MVRAARCLTRRKLLLAHFIVLVGAVTPSAVWAEGTTPQANAAPRADLLTFLLNKAKALVGSHPTRYRNHISRGVVLLEAVIPLQDGRIDLSPVLTDAGAGTYYLRWQPLSAADRSARGDPVGPLAYAWNPSTPSLGAAEGLQPGLYELLQMRWTGGAYRLAGIDRAWVLVADADTYQADHAAFLDMRATLKQQASIDAAEQKALLRAALDVLAQQSGK